jgi:hypothetical protein
MEAFVTLVRRYVEDWLNRADPEVAEVILDPGYTLHIGGQTLQGRDDAYVPATMGQLQQFPGLRVTVHDLLVAPDHVAMRFSEHGASIRHDGRSATWGGVVLFRWDGHRLTEAFVEEDYLSRRAQLAGLPCLPVEPAMPAPWEAAPSGADPAAESVVRRWLAAPDTGSVVYDDGRDDAGTHLLDVAELETHEIWSSGARVAFHAAQRGRHLGGDADGASAVMHSAGIVEVSDGRVTAGQVIRDRLGLQRSLKAAGAGEGR